MPAWRLSRRFGSAMALVALVGGLFAVSYGFSGADGQGAGQQLAVASGADSGGNLTTDGFDWT
ncbi:hypothetical protein GCM10027280_08710 [Micromonospora polyrhachis]